MAFQQLPLPASVSLPLSLVKKPSLIWVELLHVEERLQPGSFGLVRGNSPNTFTTSLLVQSGCEEEDGGWRKWIGGGEGGGVEGWRRYGTEKRQKETLGVENRI